MQTLADKQTQLNVFLESCTYSHLSEICKVLLQKQIDTEEIEKSEDVVIEKIHSFVFATKDVKVLDLCLQVLEA
jgi:hypothetical protein